MLAYPLLTLLATPYLQTEHRRRNLRRALAWGSAPIVVYGLLQAVGLDPIPWQTDAASPVMATVGRANFLGSYLVMLVPLTAGLLLRAPSGPTAVLLILQVVCLILTRARAAWIGLTAGVLVGTLAFALVTKRRRLALGIPAVGLAAAVIAAALILSFGTGAGPTPISATARLTVWRAMLPLIAERPIRGHGPETLRARFWQVYPPELVYYQGREVVVDRAHNLWLDLAFDQGLLGVVAFVAVLVAALALVLPAPTQRAGPAGELPAQRPPEQLAYLPVAIRW